MMSLRSLALFMLSMNSFVSMSSAMSIPPHLKESSCFKQQQKVTRFNKQNVHNLGSKSEIPLAMAVPGNGIGEQIFVGGFLNFLSLYNLVITARILLSWFPQAMGVPALQPVFAITDPYLNAFRGLIPPIFGLDLSPLLAFFALNAATTATSALGYEIPDKYRITQNKKSPFGKRMPKLILNKN